MRRSQAATAALGLVGIVSAALVLLVAPAQAQTGYPPGGCTTLTGTQNVGTVNVGQTFVLQLAPTCAFTPGTSLTVTVNGVNIPGKVANANGVTTVEVTVVSATQLSIDDPVLTPAICGVNSATASGPSAVAGGRTVTQTANFTLNCSAVPGTTGATSTGGPATPSTGRLSLTGANSLRWAAMAAVLLGVGALFVVATRRRASSRA